MTTHERVTVNSESLYVLVSSLLLSLPSYLAESHVLVRWHLLRNRVDCLRMMIKLEFTH